MRSHTCPDCKKCIGLTIPIVDGNLGPSTYRCVHCDGETRSGNVEWARFSPQGRHRYFRNSFVLAIVGGIFLTGLLFSALPGLESMETAKLRAYFFVVVALLSGSISAVQSWRVFDSLQRDGDGDLRAGSASLFRFESNILLRSAIPVLIAMVIFGIRFLSCD